MALTVECIVLAAATLLAKGLAWEEAACRLKWFGPNVLPKARRHGPLIRLLFHSITHSSMCCWRP